MLVGNGAARRGKKMRLLALVVVGDDDDDASKIGRHGLDESSEPNQK